MFRISRNYFSIFFPIGWRTLTSLCCECNQMSIFYSYSIQSENSDAWFVLFKSQNFCIVFYCLSTCSDGAVEWGRDRDIIKEEDSLLANNVEEDMMPVTIIDHRLVVISYSNSSSFITDNLCFQSPLLQIMSWTQSFWCKLCLL